MKAEVRRVDDDVVVCFCAWTTRSFSLPPTSACAAEKKSDGAAASGHGGDGRSPCGWLRSCCPGFLCGPMMEMQAPSESFALAAGGADDGGTFGAILLLEGVIVELHLLPLSIMRIPGENPSSVGAGDDDTLSYLLEGVAFEIHDNRGMAGLQHLHTGALQSREVDAGVAAPDGGWTPRQRPRMILRQWPYGVWPWLSKTWVATWCYKGSELVGPTRSSTSIGLARRGGGPGSSLARRSWSAGGPLA